MDLFLFRRVLQYVLLSLLLVNNFYCQGTTDEGSGHSNMCQEIIVEECKSIFSYNTTLLPNKLDHYTQGEAVLVFNQYRPLLQIVCSEYLLPFLCGTLFPVCKPGKKEHKTIPLCPYVCENATRDCEPIMTKFGYTWPEYFQCNANDTNNVGTCLGFTEEYADLYIRLADGPNPSEGRVEVSKDNITWGTVCDDFFDNDAATVVCSQLGYNWGIAYSLSHFGPGDPNSPIFLDEVICEGFEKSLLQCSTNKWGKNNCNHQEDASVSCFNVTARLNFASEQENVGLVEIRGSKGWSEVCDSGWDNTDAGVLCRELGFVSGIAITRASRGVIDLSKNFADAFWEFECKGNETSLLNCAKSDYWQGKCNEGSLAGAVCYNKTLKDINTTFDIRMVDGSSNWGRIEVKHLDVWGHICDYGWSDEAANVACRQLNFLGGVAFGTKKTPDTVAWMRYLHCNGSEDSLDQCGVVKGSTKWETDFKCNAASVLCYNVSAPAVSIVGTPSKGRVEINYDGQVGSICKTYWSRYDAKVLCRSQGFVDGHIIDNVVPGKGKIYLNKMRCNGYESSIFRCNNSGWETYQDSYCSDHSRDAAVLCYKHIRLVNSSDLNTGIVELLLHQSWYALCRTGFNEVNARVVCKELGGFTNGVKLPSSAFGSYSGQTVMPDISCNGNESSIMNCSYDTLKTCSDKNYGYAAVSCFNGTAPPDEFSLHEAMHGRVKLKRYNTTGEVCSSSWNDNTANVLCKQLGHLGGRATVYVGSRGVPILSKGFSCTGFESSLKDCKEEPPEICYKPLVAGAICYSYSAPAIKLVGGENYGRVVITIDQTEGTVCDSTWSQSEADVVCRELGFGGGEPYRVSPGTGDVILSNTWCTGTEKSLLACSSAGWRSVSSQSCLDHKYDVGVYCFQSVRIVDGIKKSDHITGRIEMQRPTGPSGQWLNICATSFDQNAATVVCRELKFDQAQVLPPGYLGSTRNYQYVTKLKCTGKEQRLVNCSFNSEKNAPCQYPNVNYASVFCSKSPFKPEIKVSVESGYHGAVLFNQLGVDGNICVDGWDDREANVTCRQFGYKGGVVLGPPEVYSRKLPVWYSNFECTGKEKSITDCPRDSKVSLDCVRSIKNAGVLCYNSTGVNVRLRYGKDYFGLVEVELDGRVGTICDYDWTKYDARVLCRQLGFPDGRAHKGSYFHPGTGPVYLSGVFCDSSEKHLLACPSRGWLNSQQYCQDHQSDASVYCYRPVSVTPGEDFGALQVWMDNTYRMVCAEEFDDVDATVACRSMGYAYGKSLCCSAFGDIDYKIRKTNIQCTGNEFIFNNCSSEDGIGRCQSEQYASVVCSAEEPPLGYGLKLTEGHYGRVKVKYFDHAGYICSEGFDSPDANVICKQLGYKGGFAYHERNPDVWSSIVNEIRWLSNITCRGNEDRLDECGKLDWGNIKNCSIKSFAAAFCHSGDDTQGPKVRLKGGKTEGIVEVLINGTWGTICSQTITNKEANVICKQLDFTYGIYVRKSGFPNVTGPVWIHGLYCTGEETNIESCQISGLGVEDPRVACNSHQYDLAVKCFSNVRLSSTVLPNYGQLQVHNESGWYSVCDDNFNNMDAKVACRSLGYKDGRAQCCSALGTWLTNRPIGITDVRCTGNETSFRRCPMTYGKCISGHYVTVACTEMNSSLSDLLVRIPENAFYGDVEVQRYGVWGSICDKDWDDADARAVCHELGFVTGNATRGTARRNVPTLVGSVNCTGNERRLKECKMSPFYDDHKCHSKSSRAAIVCSKKEEGVKFRIGREYQGAGRAEVYLNGLWGTICNIYWEDVDANAFCQQLDDYVGGFEASPAIIGYPGQPIWMTRVECKGNEKNFLECEASWDPAQTSHCTHSNDAGVMCFKSVRLMRGNYRNNGILEVYKNGRWGTVCSSGLKEKEADVACRILGFEHGIPLCCAPYGFSFKNPMFGNFSCKGNEKHLTDCSSTDAFGDNACFSQDYASVACYNGERTQKNYTLGLAGISSYTGQVNLTYLGVEGRICSDGWTNKSATVVCRELGYPSGLAYTHYKSDVDSVGPYWSSEFNCTGNEDTLADCPHVGFGNVKKCQDRHYAGVLCFEKEGVYYRMAGGDSRYGRVEVSVRGEWGTICDRYWDQRDADVFCRQIGFNTGDPYYENYITPGMGTVWGTMIHCKGTEKNLNDCPHEGWKITDSVYCRTHKDDAGVQCYTNVKISNGILSRNSNTGAVMLYQNRTWLRVCDTGFDDMTARVVCEELGYVDGRAICCSAFGHSDPALIQTNYTLRCNGREKSVLECLRREQCTSANYASVVCFSANDTVSDDDYSFYIQGKSAGQVVVSHYGVQGRICSQGWGDMEARVICHNNNYLDGMAYFHDERSTISSMRGPYWLSNFNCTGTESDLLNCSHNSRMDLGNCSKSHIASVLCFNDSGIEYFIVGGHSHYGRVEVAIGGRRGTVCDASWDNKDASVLCREKGFSEGVALPGAAYGQGTGPIWQSHIQCEGNEPGLRWCPHRGFVDRFSESSWLLPLICDSHRDDASVFCYRNVRLNEGHDSPMGGVEVYMKSTNKWYGICDTGFDNNAAKVVCKSLGMNYVDGRALRGSAFGNLTGQIQITDLQCKGSEQDLLNCSYSFNKTKCPSGHYASVQCSNTTTIDDGFAVQIAPDSLSSAIHGIVEVRINGIWGRVCMNNWDDRDANVTCNKLGFAGGVAYLHIMKNRKPILMNRVHCKGTEDTLFDCPHSTEPDLENCGFNSNDAGILCYKKDGIYYHLNGGAHPATGRVELSYDGVNGTVCAWSWKTADAKVLCRQLGYADGIVSYDVNPKLPIVKRWITGYFCQGEEKTLMTCLNTGFNSSFLDDLCMYREPGAYTSCFNKTIAPTDIRLQNGRDKYSGRLEIFVEGPNLWGTICDDFWDDAAAQVACRQLGFAGGKPVKEAGFGPGTGPIWFDNVKCFGNESTIWDCNHRGVGTHNCNHTEDVGVQCSGPMTSTIAPVITTTLKKTTTKQPQTTSTTTTQKPTTRKPPTRQTTKSTTSTTPRHTIKTTTTSTTTTTTAAVTTKRATTRPTTKSTTTSTTSTTSTSVTQTSTLQNNVTIRPPENQQDKSPDLAVILAVPIVIFILIVIALGVVFVIKTRRFNKRDNIPHERFHNDMIEHNPDGSISISNQLYDMNLQPTTNINGFPEGSTSQDDKLTLSKNGSAYYAKPHSNGNNDTKHAFANPLYGHHSSETVTGSNAEALPEQDEVRFPIDDTTSKA